MEALETRCTGPNAGPFGDLVKADHALIVSAREPFDELFLQRQSFIFRSIDSVSVRLIHLHYFRYWCSFASDLDRESCRCLVLLLFSWLPSCLLICRLAALSGVAAFGHFLCHFWIFGNERLNSWMFHKFIFFWSFILSKYSQEIPQISINVIHYGSVV
jgi:hypothetical protein